MPRTRLVSAAAAALCAGAILAGACQATAGEIRLAASGVHMSVPVKSMKERRWATVVKQQRDYSCGSAAVATLLTHHYGHPVGETEVLQAMFEVGDQAKIMAEGFSLLDMQRFLASRGYKADGFRVTLDKLAEVGIPAIVLVNLRGYRHFVVIKGITADEVVIGDPMRGLIRYPRADFQQLLANDIVFVIRSDLKLAQASFNRQADWAANPKAPLGDAVGLNSLASVTMLLPRTNEF